MVQNNVVRTTHKVLMVTYVVNHVTLYSKGPDVDGGGPYTTQRMFTDKILKWSPCPPEPFTSYMEVRTTHEDLKEKCVGRLTLPSKY